jgi:exosortase C (VPDSG-CTERM-specific)
MPASVSQTFTGQVAAWRALPRRERLRIAGFVGWIVVLTLAFIQPLARLVQYADQSNLNSYIPLVPFVAGYILFVERHRLPTAFVSSIAGAVGLSTIAALALFGAIRWSAALSINDGLGLSALAYVSAIAAGGFLFLGSRWMAAAAFPMAFLFFIVPLPDVVVYQIERASVLASAEVSEMLFRMTGTPLLRDGNIFALPGIVLEIAQECSGIHSSWVLFITSLVAAQLLIRSPWRRLILVTFVLPLAIFRNSVRIVTIGLLCVHVGPHMIDSWIHNQGGPVFFALSLGPLFLLLLWLRLTERR